MIPWDSLLPADVSHVKNAKNAKHVSYVSYVSYVITKAFEKAIEKARKAFQFFT
mgnify:CR=1 FL=1